MSDAPKHVEPDAPILVFDSGIGGLSVLQAVRAALPHAPFVYAADYAGLPYGTKSEAEITARVPALLGRLVERYHPRLIVIACNTASTIALAHVRAALDLPVVGTVPAIKPAAEISQSRIIGVLGTEATVRQAYVTNLAREHASDCTLLRHGAPDLVHAAETHIRGASVDPLVFESAIAGLADQPGGGDMDVVVLACTHFPLLEDQLAKASAKPIAFIHGAAGIARRVAFLTKGQSWPQGQGKGVFVSTSGGASPPDQDALLSYGFARFEAL